MVKNSKKKILLLGLAMLAVLFSGGAYFYYNQEKESTPKPAQELQDNKSGDIEAVTEKPKEDPTTEKTRDAVATMEGTSLTATLMKEAITIGGQSYPADSIILLFYTGPGTYNVQKMVGDAWKTTATNLSYSGTGGLGGGYLGSGEDNVSLRIQKVEGGKITAESKAFVVMRSDLTFGIKTYN
jgi:hypothetical protein